MRPDPARVAPPAESAARDRSAVPALGGRLAAVSLFDLCQFLMLNRKTGTLTVRAPEGTAYFTFHEGQLLSATDEALRDGEGVVLRAVQWRDGTFEFAPGPVPPDRRIQASTESILLEAARQVDEMMANGSGAGEPSAAESFLEKQERAAGLSEAFRRVVALGDADRKGCGWRDAARASLRRPGAWRLRLGPGARVAIVHSWGLEEIEGTDPGAVVAWAEELAPTTGGREDRRTRERVPAIHVTPDPDGGSFWAIRQRGPDGDWVLASLALPDVPAWAGLGFPDPLFAELQAQSEGWTLLLAPGVSGNAGEIWPGGAALAAWVAHRAGGSPEVACIVESLPRYEWSRLPGRIVSVSPEHFRRPGTLERHIRTQGVRFLALAEAPPALAGEALALSAPGLRVVILGAAAAPAAWIRSWARRCAPPLDLAAIEGSLGAVWTVQGTHPERSEALTCRLAVPARPGASASTPPR